jgi:hypothetical protein
VAPLVLDQTAIDMLYVDVPITGHAQAGPEEIFAFVQAVAQQVKAKVLRPPGRIVAEG